MNKKDEKMEIIPSVTITEFVELLPILFRAREVPVLLISHTGIGKTQSVQKFCEDNRLDHRNIRLSYIEAQDIVGFPQVKDNTMVYIQPDFLPQEPQSRGILFFDEINRARIDVLQAVFQLILERELGVGNTAGETYKVPEGWFVIASQNPDTDEYYVSPIDAALFNRFLIIPVRYDETAYREFVRNGEQYHPLLSGFIHDEDLLIKSEDIDNIEIHPSPRSFELFNKVLSRLLPGEYHLLPIIGNGLIGPTNYDKFSLYRFKNNSQVVTLLNDVLKGTYENSLSTEKILRMENENPDLVVGVLDRFVENKFRTEEGFGSVKENGGLKYFMNFLFRLSNEQIVATILGMRKGLEKWKGGVKYLPFIDEFIGNNEEAKIRYNAILKKHKELRVEEFI